MDKPKLKESPPENLKKKGGRPKGSGRQLWLSPVEQEVVDLMCDGYKSNEIAKLLGRSHVSISSTLERAKRKTKARSLYHLVTINVTKKLKEGDSNGRHRGNREGSQDQEGGTAGESESSKAASTAART